MSQTAITIPDPPVPRDPRTHERWKHTRLRRRLMYGGWYQDLVERLEKEIGSVRRSAWGEPDRSSNVFKSAMVQLAVLYDRAPTVTAPAGGDELVAEVERAGWWSLAQRVQRDTLAFREMFVHVEVVEGEDGPELQYRPVFPDLVEAECRPDRPEEPAHFWEAVQRTINGEKVWTWDEWDIRDPAAPSFKVWDADRKKDISASLGLGGLVGDAYIERWSTEDGTPILPFVTYHAAKTGTLFDAFEAEELVEGALNIGVMWTEFKHSVKHCSFRQRYAGNLRVRGVQGSEDDDDESDRRELIADASVLLEFEVIDPSAPILIGAFETPQDPVGLQEAIALYERRVAVMGGISASDIQRVAGDPRSGYAIAISTEGKRAAARRFEPIFRRSDERLLRLSALLWSRSTKTEIPTAGYRVSYAAIPPSPEEQTAERSHLLELLDRGLITRVDVYRAFNPGTTLEDAEKALAAIAAANGDASTSPFASVGLPALVQGGIIGASAARRLLGVDEDAAPTPAELAALRGTTTQQGASP